MSVIIAFGANFVLQASGAGANSQGTRMVSAILGGTFAVIGIVAGIVALFGIRRYGRKGLLWHAVTGIGLWLLLFVLALPVVFKARQLAALRKPTPLAPVTRLPNATRVADAELGFSFDLPEGFEALAPAAKPPKYRHAFARAVSGEPSRVILVEALGGTLPKKRLSPQDIAARKSISLLSFNWRGLEVDGVRVPEKLQDTDYLTFNVQIPLRPQAIQIGFGGPAESESQLRSLAENVLATLDGNSTW